MDPRTYLSATFGRGDGKAAEVEPGLALMKQSDCFNCHALEQKVVGPALLDIATKYRGQDGALETTIQRVIKGSSRVWGEVPMLAHESLHSDQVRIMVRWVFGLERGKGGPALQRGLRGKLLPPEDPKLQSAQLEATYADSGRPPVASLTSRAVVSLRSRQLEAESADEKQGVKTLGSIVGSIDDGHSITFKSLNLSDSKAVKLRVGSGGQGGRIELRSGSPDGNLLADLSVKPTGGWDKWVVLEAPLEPIAERVDLLVRFINPGQAGLMNLDWISFEPIPQPVQ
jgi:cytochrome c